MIMSSKKYVGKKGVCLGSEELIVRQSIVLAIVFNSYTLCPAISISKDSAGSCRRSIICTKSRAEYEKFS